MNKSISTNNNVILDKNSVTELTKVSNAGNNIKNELKAKYGNIVERKDKRKIINLIKTDLINKYYNVSLLEIEILSSNIYYYACLIAENVSEEDIVNYISFENEHYYPEITNKELKRFNSEINMRYIKYLVNKYAQILKTD